MPTGAASISVWSLLSFIRRASSAFLRSVISLKWTRETRAPRKTMGATGCFDVKRGAVLSLSFELVFGGRLPPFIRLAPISLTLARSSGWTIAKSLMLKASSRLYPKISQNLG